MTKRLHFECDLSTQVNSSLKIGPDVSRNIKTTTLEDASGSNIPPQCYDHYYFARFAENLTFFLQKNNVMTLLAVF
jgi:hypothetical protein